jgi:hypothetical protein
MRNKRKLSYTRLVVPVLLFAGVQIFAQAAVDSRMQVAGSASQKMMKPHADVVLISDRTFLMNDIKEIMMSQKFKSQSVGIGCSSSISAVPSDSCPVIDCPAPPPGCSYGPPETNANGCPISCGQLVCGSEN